MKLLLFTYEFPPITGGISRYCYMLTKELSGLGVEPIVLTYRSFQSKESLDSREQFKIIGVPKLRSRKLNFLTGKTDILLSIFYLIYSILRYKPDHILVTHGRSQLIFSLLSLILPLKFTVVVIGSDVIHHSKNKTKKWLFEKLCLKANKILAISKFTKNLLLDKYPSLREKTTVIYIGIDPKWLTFPKEKGSIQRIKEKLNISNKKIILTIARLTPRKGHDLVIKALSRISQTIPDSKYVIGGKGSGLDRLKSLIKTYGLQDKVIFAGFVPPEETISFYDMCNVFVMPSREEKGKVEGFGISFIEAGARGKPVIGGNHGGVPEVIVNGKTGFLVDPHDTEELANTIIKLLTDKKLAKKMGQRGKERVSKYFTSKVMAQKTLVAIKDEK